MQSWEGFGLRKTLVHYLALSSDILLSKAFSSLRGLCARIKMAFSWKEARCWARQSGRLATTSERASLTSLAHANCSLWFETRRTHKKATKMCSSGWCAPSIRTPPAPADLHRNSTNTGDSSQMPRAFSQPLIVCSRRQHTLIGGAFIVVAKSSNFVVVM